MPRTFLDKNEIIFLNAYKALAFVAHLESDKVEVSKLNRAK